MLAQDSTTINTELMRRVKMKRRLVELLGPIGSPPKEDQHHPLAAIHRLVDVDRLLTTTMSRLTPTTTDDECWQLMAEIATGWAVENHDWPRYAGRIEVSLLHDRTVDSFYQAMMQLHGARDQKTGRACPRVSDELIATLERHRDVIEKEIDWKRDYCFDMFGIRTLKRTYLLRVNGNIVERPQAMFMRVALGVHGDDIESALQQYRDMSRRLYIHATPTLFNAGTPRPQMSSCFLLPMRGDSITGIFKTVGDCAEISKYAGGIGISVQNIRARGSPIAGTGGASNGLVPMLQVLNATARYVDQGGGKRKGSFAVYIEPWHADIFDFLDLRKNTGAEERRARDLFLGLWINDLFMKRVRQNQNWSLFCPNQAPGLADVWGDDFDKLYLRYEREGLAMRTVKAHDIWKAILVSQIETGTPYCLYKDACNRKSNQQNLGTIKCANLCTEVVQYSDPDETAVCNLASISLPAFVDQKHRSFDFDALRRVTGRVCRNLNRVLERNFYPLESARRSNMRHRPIGIGVQGMADCFALMRIAFESDTARDLNLRIFETMYFGAVEASVELARLHGPYETFEGSPMSKGQLQPDMWEEVKPITAYDWDGLRRDVKKYGVRNSLLIAPMPTASTSQILGNNECFEPMTSNVYSRRVLAGDFPVVNRYMVKELMDRGQWTPEVWNEVLRHQGSIAKLSGIPPEMKRRYRTIWEISQKALVNLAGDRAPFICQNQSMNVYFEAPNTQKLTALHFHCWRRGMKSSCYYLRSRPRADAIQFAVDKRSKLPEQSRSSQAPQQSTLPKLEPEPEAECLMCGA